MEQSLPNNFIKGLIFNLIVLKCRKYNVVVLNAVTSMFDNANYFTKRHARIRSCRPLHSMRALL